jgi:hypothetical protein
MARMFAEKSLLAAVMVHRCECPRQDSNLRPRTKYDKAAWTDSPVEAEGLMRIRYDLGVR